MDTKELAENVKRLREIYGTGQGYGNFGEAARFAELTHETINALVQLVGEMGKGLTAARYEAAEINALNVNVQHICNEMLTKSTPIAALVKEG